MFTLHYNIAQNRPDNFPSYPLDNHHCSDDVYLREGGNIAETPSPPEDSIWALMIVWRIREEISKREIAVVLYCIVYDSGVQ